MMRDLGLISKLPRIAVAQTAAANPLYLSYLTNFETFKPVAAKPTLASAIQIGNPVSFKKAVRTLQQFGGVVEQASEAELADASARADLTGLFNCPHTGVALAALEKLVARGLIESRHKVVVVSTASGLKFTDFKVQYHEGTLREVPNPRHANQPVHLSNAYPEVRDAVRKILGE